MCRWYREFEKEMARIQENKDELTQAMRIKDPHEKEARVADITRKIQGEGCAYLPSPILYPINSDASHLFGASPRRGRGKSNSRRRRGGGGGGCATKPSTEDDGPDSSLTPDNAMVYDEYEDYQSRAADECDDCDEDDDDSSMGECGEMPTGIPELPLIMGVNIQGKFVREPLMLFISKFGSLPLRASMLILDMMYKNSMHTSSTTGQLAGIMECIGNLPPGVKASKLMLQRALESNENGDGETGDDQELLPMHLFLRKGCIMQAYSRRKANQSDPSTMAGFKYAGCELHTYNSVMDVIRSTKDSVRKIRQFQNYLRRVHKQHISSVLNNELCSSNALYAVTYLEQAKYTVCQDLVALIKSVAPQFFTFMMLDKCASRIQNKSVYVVREEAYAQVKPLCEPSNF